MLMHDQHGVARAQAGESLESVLARGAGRAVAGGTGRGLAVGERLEVLDTLATVLGGAYGHLPQKRAAYAADPVQGLHLLARQSVDMTDGEFHRALTGLVVRLRDAHTRYAGPGARGGPVAALPFLVEAYEDSRGPVYAVTHVAEHAGLDGEGFGPGVTVVSWNGVPMDRAVDLYAEQETGGRPDSRRARALSSLTFRPLRYGPPPDEGWVDVRFRHGREAVHEIRVPWRVVDPGRGRDAVSKASEQALRFAGDPAGHDVRRARQLMFAPEVWAAQRLGADATTRAGWLPTSLPDVVGARVVRVRGGDVGYLRLWSFDISDDDAYLDEVARLLGLLPARGLVVDLRGNPGGLIWAAERLLQLLTPNEVVPTRFSLLASPLTREMAASPFNRVELGPWWESLDQAVVTGEAYSRPLPLTAPEWCNDRSLAYDGPVVAVVDANTYSAGDLFAAGFVDNGVGPLVCVGQATGAGGANVWTSEHLRAALDGTPYAFDPLPRDVGFTMSFRRAVRSGPADGVPIEDLGIGGIPYALTRRDLFEDNRDLVAFCARVLEREVRPNGARSRRGTA